MHRAWITAAATALTLPALVGAAVTGAMAGVTYTCGGETATIVGNDSGDTLVGTPLDDVIVGLDGTDTIDGLAGDDVICGGRGIDTIDAGRGDDTVYGGADGRAHGIEGDSIEGGPGNDTLHGGLDPSESGGSQENEDVVVYADAPRGVHITLGPGETTVTGQGVDTIDGFNSVFGSQHDDVITAGAETDVVRGFGGDDRTTVDSEEGEVFGGNGDDVMRLGYYVYGNHGDDDIRFASKQASGGTGNDVMVSTKHRDVYRAGPGDDVMRGRQGRDALYGEEGSDRIVGGGRDDVVYGGPQADRLDGGRGDDQLEPGDETGQGRRPSVADDVARGGAGRDTVAYPDTSRPSGVRVDLAEGLATRVGRDQLMGVENVSGGPRGDQLFGDAGRNLLTGSGGDDNIVGRGGDDAAIGDKGVDRCEAETETSCER
ncbi:MAG: hypothetical protein H0V48_05995 [Nocardioidaceae bacterium]|nr:hypothetical protein [Nocardioidaceae bacterium]